MADYLPLHLLDIVERKDEDTGEIRKSAVCRTVQPEQFNLNLSRLDATRLQSFVENKGKVLMVPIRRGEINGRAFTSVADGFIFPAVGIESTFEIKQHLSPAPIHRSGEPEPSATSAETLSATSAETLPEHPSSTAAGDKPGLAFGSKTR